MDGFNEAVQSELQRQIDTGLIFGGVAGVVGSPLYYGGLQWFRNEKKDMAQDSIFDLASVGKTFTAFLISKLVGEGRIDPDAPFTDYLPQHVLAKENCKISVRNLAMHTGGFDNSKPYIVSDPVEFDRRLYAKRPVYPCGEVFEYACSNFIYLGRIIENITGLDLEEAAKKFIWEPLGMVDTCWHNIPNNQRVVETSTNGKIPIGIKSDEQARGYPKAMGNGAAFSTARDMLLFAQEMLDRSLLTKEAYDLMFECHFEMGDDRRSFGWEMSPSRTPKGWSRKTISHGGWTGNTIAVDPVNGYAGIVLTNRRGDRLEGYAGHARLLSLITGSGCN